MPWRRPCQLGRRKGLGNIVVGPGLHGLDGRLDRRMARDHHDFGGNPRRLDLPENIQSRHARHHEVQQDHVELAREGGIQSGAGIVEILDFVPGGAQGPAATDADDRLVVDHGDAERNRFWNIGAHRIITLLNHEIHETHEKDQQLTGKCTTGR